MLALEKLTPHKKWHYRQKYSHLGTSKCSVSRRSVVGSARIFLIFRHAIENFSLQVQSLLYTVCISVLKIRINTSVMKIVPFSR